MSKKLYFLISFVMVLSLASVGYSAAISADALVRIDFDDSSDPNVYNHDNPDTDVNSVEPGFISFVLDPDVCDLGSLGFGDVVNDIQIDFYGEKIDERRRGGPNDITKPPFPEFQINEEGIHRDFIYSAAAQKNTSVDIDLWGLGAHQKVDIHIWAFDDGSKGERNRIANWTANGEELLQTNFIGGDENKWPRDGNPEQYRHYDFNGIARADEYGHIYLTSERDSNSDRTHPFSYVNALEIYPSVATPNAVNAPHRYKPFDGSEDVNIDTAFSWRPGDLTSPNYDVYLSTDPCNLTFLTTEGSNSVDPYGASSYLAMDKTYYLRVDANLGGNTYSGPVQTITTKNHWDVDTFDAYGTSDELTDVWPDYYDGTGNSAEIYISKSSEDGNAISGNSMDYFFLNTYDPYYSESWVILDDTDLAKKTDKNFNTMDVYSLSIWFYGQTSNPVNQKMYAKLIDDNGKTAKVLYSGDMNDITVEQWKEWNIAMQEFIDANNAIDLTDVNRISIGFDVGTPHADGRIFFDDVRIYTRRCVTTARSAQLARADYAPIGDEDCIVDPIEIEVIGRDWLLEDLKTDTCEVSPTDPNLVLYLPFDEFTLAQDVPDGELVFYEDDLLPEDINGIRCTKNMAPSPHPNCIWVELSCLDANEGEDPIEIVGPGMIFYDINNNPKKTDGNSILCDKTNEGLTGERVHCGRWNQVGNWGVGGWDRIAGVRTYQAGDANSASVYANTGELTCAVWIKWAGPHTGLRNKCQGMIGKREGWSKDGVNFMFECDTVDAPRGSFSLRQYHGPYCIYTQAGILDQFIGQWIHLAVVADINSADTEDANEAVLYLNGSPVQEGPFYFGGPANPNLITLTVANNAEFSHQDVENFLGEMDEVRVYSRGLEPNEVAYLADITPDDGTLSVPVPSVAEIYLQEPEGKRIVNFKDYAIMANQWLKKEYWP